MKIADKVLNKFGYIRKRITNFFTGAQSSRLVNNWATQNVSGDTTLRNSLTTLRARSRERGRNDDYAKKYLRSSVINILGSKGITFQSKVKLRNNDKVYDEAANTKIEFAFADWGKRRNSPEVTGKLSWRGIQKIVIKTAERDGEVLIRKVKNFPNKYRFALQLFEADYLDEFHNMKLANGNEIRMGIELDEWKRPVAYHLLINHPGDFAFPRKTSQKKYERIPAEDIIHYFDMDRINDTRGLPGMHTALFRMKMLNGYEEAELVAARVSAAKMGIIVSPNGEPIEGDGQDEDGNVIVDAEPGTFPTLPEGYDMKMFDPQHPSGNFPPFTKQMLRGMASGLGISYNSLASDLESVNYSSIRSGTLEERDNWKEKQATFTEDFCDPVYEGFLLMWLVLPGTQYGILDLERFLNAAKWTARSWDWVDPLKDQKANTEGLRTGTITYTEILAEQGKDFEEHIEVLKHEQEVLKEAGLEFDLKGKPAAAKKADDPDDDPDELEEKEMTHSKGGNNGNGKYH